MALQNGGQNWWKVEPEYSNKVLIGNWLEERKRLTEDTGKLCSSINGTDFICFGDHAPGQTLRTIREKLEGLPMQHLFGHHNEPRSRYLVSEYDDKYNRHGSNVLLPPFRTWNGHKLPWIPQRSDFPICEPPTNYGLLEYLMKKWYQKDAEVMKSVYTISYERPPISAFATYHLRQPAKAQDLLSNQGYLQNISQILDYEGAQKYLQAIRQLVGFSTEGHGRFRRVCRATVASIGQEPLPVSGRHPRPGEVPQGLSWLHEPKSSIVNEIS